jgi:hypothetical protein
MLIKRIPARKKELRKEESSQKQLLWVTRVETAKMLSLFYSVAVS